MDSEKNRLSSFVAWPQNAPVQPRHLANSGFFATGNFLETECNWCHKRIQDWDYGDVIEERHKNIAPECPFLTKRLCCGNIVLTVSPVNPEQEQLPQQQQSENSDSTTRSYDLFVETNRLATFKNWPNPNISPYSLAKAGFFYLNRSDEVKCAWCKGVIAKWEKQDNAFEEHKRFFPDCPRVQLGPLIEMASDGIRDLGIQQISPPKEPKYASLDARLRTYSNWPIPQIQRPKALAHAGLYYQNYDDHVRCFHCNIGLRCWEKDDDPWFEHAKWFPDCHFVRLVKGASYVQNVQQLTRQSVHEACEATNQMPTITLEEAMTTTPVKQALEIGIDAGSIRAASQRQLIMYGRPYTTVEDLLKAVFNDRDIDNEGSDSGSESGSDRALLVRLAPEDIYPSISEPTDLTSDAIPSTSERSVTSRPSVRQSGDVPPDIEPTASVATTITQPVIPIVQDSNTNPVHDVKVQEQPKTENRFQRTLSLEEENRKLKDARLCKVCLDDEVGVVFLPCGHLVTCVQCAPTVDQCPMCRSTIKGFVRTYLS